MLANIYRKIIARQFILRRYAIDKDTFFGIRNMHNEVTYCRCLSNSFTKPGKNFPASYLKNTVKHNTNLATENKDDYEETKLLSFLNEEITDEDVEKMLNLDWSKLSSTEFMTNIKKLSVYINKHEESPNVNFENLLQGLSVLSYGFTRQDLDFIISCLILWNKKTTTLRDTTIQILTILDNEFLKKLKEMNITDEALAICLIFNRIRHAKKSAFVGKAVLKIKKKLKNMSPSQIATFMRLISMAKNLPLNLYEIEYDIENKLSNFSLIELKYVLLGFSANEYKIRSRDFRVNICKAILKNAEEITSLELRPFSQYVCLNYKTQDQVDEILQKILKSFESKVEEFSFTGLTHLLVLASHPFIHEEKLITSILERVDNEINNAKIRELERIVCSMAKFNYDSKHPLYKKIVAELNSSNRQEEISLHVKSLMRILQHLACVNIYPTDLIDKVMAPEFIKASFKSPFSMERTHYFLDQSIAAELPSYTGPALSDELRNFFARASNHKTGYGFSNLNTFTKELKATCERILKTTSSVYVDKILPQYYEKDVIVCLDENSNPVNPEPLLSPMTSATVKPILEEGRNYKWIILIPTSAMMQIKFSEDFNGLLVAKCRQLKKLGYTPLPVLYTKWYAKNDDEDCEKYQEDYVRSLLKIK